jgi:hypothetical protein
VAGRCAARARLRQLDSAITSEPGTGCRKGRSALTIFHSRKLPFRDYLTAIALFVNGVKGKSAPELGRDLDVSYETAYVLAHKLREAMGADEDKSVAKGEVEIDGAYFAGAHDPHPGASGSHATTPFALGFRPCTISGGGRPIILWSQALADGRTRAALRCCERQRSRRGARCIPLGPRAARPSCG